MTRNEAVDRAKKIWGDGLVLAVGPGAIAGEWFVNVDSGIFKWHLLDGNGHPRCHPACTWLEAEYCGPQGEPS